MAIKVYGDKIVFPDNTEQTTAPTQLDGYDKAEIDNQQAVQDDKIQANTDAIEVNANEISDKVSEAPTDGKPYARKNKGWHEVETGTGDVEEAPSDGKTYGRKNEAWSEVVTDSYTKAEIDNQQAIQDDAIADNTTDIATNTADIAENKTNITKNTTDIESLMDDVDALTGSVIYKGSLNATVTPAPADAVVGDMYINEYNVAEPATNYPVASGWSPVTEVKYDDKLIKTDTGWDKIESVVGVPSYTAGEIDELLDNKADKGDSYLKAEADTLLDGKADSDLVYTKVESDAKNDAQDTAIQDNTDAINALPTPVDTYTKDEIDGLQIVQDTAIQANADDIQTNADNIQVNADKIQANTDAINALPSSDDYYNKTEIDASQSAQDTEIAKKQDTGVSYTKTESDTLLDAKADKSTTYTKAEVDASQATQDTEIAKKANQATTYTKTEVDDSQALQNTEIAKKADKATTYTKDEVDELLESASGAIVGNYTNKHASSVARDPLAGNLYLSNGMSFSTDYNAVTSIYISDTDGDGEVRDFDEVKVSDKITLTSVDGSGEYTIVTISDVGGYRELVVNTESATGTIADDTPVSIVLDVASSGETGGGIEEAPADGKQYARQDEAWTEVEATSGDGVVAQPPVAFSFRNPSPFTNVSINETDTEVPFSEALVDTENGKVGNTYVVKKEGIYNLQFKLRVTGAPSKLQYALARLKINGEQVSVSSFDYSNTFSNASSPSGSYITSLKVGDVISLTVVGRNPDGNVNLNLGDFTSLSGHMVSSITEGEVKEKEAVAYETNLSTPFVLKDVTWTDVPYNKVVTDTNSSHYAEENAFRPTVAGWYKIDCMFGEGMAEANSLLYLELFKNKTDSIVKKQNVRSSIAWYYNYDISGLVYLNGTTDYVTLKAYYNSESKGDYTTSANSHTNKFTAHLITGQSSGGNGTGSGETTDILPVLYSGVVDSGGNLVEGSGYTPSRLGEGYYQIDFNTPLSNNKYTVNVTPASTASNFHATFSDTSTSGFKIKVGNQSGGVSLDKDMSFGFTVTGTETIAVGGGSGGSYTPEKLVWEDKISEREWDTEYTNTNDVPLYVQPYLTSTGSDSYGRFLIDGIAQGVSGNGISGSDNVSYMNPLYIVPAGSKYKLQKNGSVNCNKWKEARMPVAVATGGASIDYEEGEYDAELTIGDTVNATAKATYSRIGNQVTLHVPTLSVRGKTGTGQVKISTPFKFENNHSTGVARFGGFGNLGTSTTIAPHGASGQSVMYLQSSNADGYVVGQILDNNCNDNFDIYTIDITYKTSGFSSSGSGGSGGGDSIWKDVDGDAVLENKDKKVTIDANVGELGLKSRITTDASILELKAGSGGLPDVTISDTEINLGSVQFTTDTGNTLVKVKGNAKDWGFRNQESGAFGTFNYTDGKWSYLHNDDGSHIFYANDSEAMKIIPDGRTYMYGVNNYSGPATPNVAIGPDGQMFKSTTATYSAEEVDKKLAVMQKIIDKLEKKLK